MKEFRYTRSVAPLELSQPVCSICNSGRINEWIRGRGVTGIRARCCP